MTLLGEGKARKLVTQLHSPVSYHMPLGEQEIPLNELLGKSLSLSFTGKINCIYCDRKTNKSFNQGYCFPCFRSLARCDSCIVSPEKCHFAAGTCREPEWGEANCMIDHYVYLANTSGLKVGITRGTQIPTRWMDQGATQAMPIFRVSNRLNSGLVETVFKLHVADKTSWQAMLKGDAENLDLVVERDRLQDLAGPEINILVESHGVNAVNVLNEQSTTDIRYPVLEYPTKVKSFNLDKNPSAEGTLMGIKGQYLIFDTGVINIRKYGGYQLRLATI